MQLVLDSEIERNPKSPIRSSFETPIALRLKIQDPRDAISDDECRSRSEHNSNPHREGSEDRIHVEDVEHTIANEFPKRSVPEVEPIPIVHSECRP